MKSAEARKQECPWKKGGCKGSACMAWYFYIVYPEEEGEMRRLSTTDGYCRVIKKMEG